MKDLFLKSGLVYFNSKDKTGIDFSVGSFILSWLVSKLILTTEDCCSYGLNRYVEEIEIGGILPPYVILQDKHLKGLNPIIKIIKEQNGSLSDLATGGILITINSNGDVILDFIGIKIVKYKVIII